MAYLITGFFFVVLIGITTYATLKYVEVRSDRDRLILDYEERISKLSFELAEAQKLVEFLRPYSNIPRILEKSQRLEEDLNRKVEAANAEVLEIIEMARQKAKRDYDKRIEAADALEAATRSKVKEQERYCNEIVQNAELNSKEIIDAAKSQARSIAKDAREKADDKLKKADELLGLANIYTRDVRRKADEAAAELSGKAIMALKRFEFYVKACKVLKVRLEQHLVSNMFPSTSILDDWSDEFGFDEAGKMLRLARDRTKKMIAQRLAGDSDYPDTVRKEFAIHFILDAFNGKVETILSRVKPDNFTKLSQEIEDAFIIVNTNGKAFKNTQVSETYKDSRIDELKWACVIQKIRQRQRDEQRAIREKIRDEERARKEFERALKQARRDEELLEKALEKARRQFESAAAEEKSTYLQKIDELEAKIAETEGYIKRTQSLAELTKQGHVYIISNVGSFGENVYKIGLTRRLNPQDRVNELGDASVPFRFDIHTAIWSEDAPALEYALHKQFVDHQVNKVNKRKEFFRVTLNQIKQAVENMGIQANWTLVADAAEFRESIALEEAMKQDTNLRKRWMDDQLKYEPELAFDENDSENDNAVPYDSGNY